MTQTLLIGTFSGLVYVWNLETQDKPQLLVNLKRTVTNIRSSRGKIKINAYTHKQKEYLIFGTIAGQLSLYSHDLEGSALSSKDLSLEWSIIAHEPSDGPFNENFGSLCKSS